MLMFIAWLLLAMNSTLPMSNGATRASHGKRLGCGACGTSGSSMSCAVGRVSTKGGRTWPTSVDVASALVRIWEIETRVSPISATSPVASATRDVRTPPTTTPFADPASTSSTLLPRTTRQCCLETIGSESTMSFSGERPMLEGPAGSGNSLPSSGPEITCRTATTVWVPRSATACRAVTMSIVDPDMIPDSSRVRSAGTARPCPLSSSRRRVRDSLGLCRPWRRSACANDFATSPTVAVASAVIWMFSEAAPVGAPASVTLTFMRRPPRGCPAEAGRASAGPRRSRAATTRRTPRGAGVCSRRCAWCREVPAHRRR